VLIFGQVNDIRPVFIEDNSAEVALVVLAVKAGNFIPTRSALSLL
jgi:hypothetical protein